MHSHQLNTGVMPVCNTCKHFESDCNKGSNLCVVGDCDRYEVGIDGVAWMIKRLYREFGFKYPREAYWTCINGEERKKYKKVTPQQIIEHASSLLGNLEELTDKLKKLVNHECND